MLNIFYVKTIICASIYAFLFFSNHWTALSIYQ